eukprot:30182_1
MTSFYEDHVSNGYQTVQIVEPKKKKRSLLFDRVQSHAIISDFRKYINKNTNIYHTDQHKRTILMFTAQNYHLEVFIYLVANCPKLILHTDDKDMNIMHYIASSNTDDESMVELITNKKFRYNKLVWMRNKEGLLPKDIAKQSQNKHIIKTLESIMHDTWSEYSYIARDNNLQSLHIDHINHINNIDIASDSDDMDMMHRPDVISPHKPTQNNDASSHYQPLTISSRKRRRGSLGFMNDDEEDRQYESLVSFNISKRRKLNGAGTYAQQPTLSPSPLPPLPPIGMAPFSLSDSSMPHSSPSSSTNSSLSGSIPCTSFLSLSTLPYTPPRVNRSRAVPQTATYQVFGRNMDEISIANRYYNGNRISRQQLVFCQWFLKRFGANRLLPIVIEKGYDDLHKFMQLREDALPHEIKTLSRNHVFGEYNNGVCIGGIESNVEMDRFSDRLRELQLSEDMETMNECNHEDEDDDL